MLSSFKVELALGQRSPIEYQPATSSSKVAKIGGFPDAFLQEESCDL